jgi:hypothetical protein
MVCCPILGHGPQNVLLNVLCYLWPLGSLWEERVVPFLTSYPLRFGGVSFGRRHDHVSIKEGVRAYREVVDTPLPFLLALFSLGGL